ncbi:MAG: molecular chaperone HtpG [Bdellovibrionaceae bacterium]|nr:molecular chaperone HtpG [Pseudobdellovibrionaceae bacterium]
MKQTQTFNAEIKKLLDLMIHSLYSHKEIFLRELVSNASDALDKLRFETLTKPELTPKDHTYQIRLIPNKENKTLKIQDSGIGMTKEEVVEYIGTIARSGTQSYQKISQELKDRPELIGQFGVGFYSSFMVAEKVTLHTQKAGANNGVVWESNGDGTYTIDEVPRPEGTGTTITLHLKTFEADDNVSDFTDEWTLKSLVKKYSDFISHPIVMKTKNQDKEEDQTLNSMKALWLRSASDIKPEEYTEFYHHLSHDWNDPLKTVHYKAEGTMEFNCLLYIPAKKPFNFHSRDTDYGLNLYVKRVFIMNDCKDLIPQHLRFVKGLVDSADLSLNVSREILQQDRQVQLIKKNVTHKIYTTLKELLTNSRKEYEGFWKEFGSTLKEGIAMDMSAKDKLQDLLLFNSSIQEGPTTLDEYITRMKPEQKEIFFITGESLSQVKNTPYMEKLNEKGFEVLLCVDPVDEWVMSSLTTYKDKKIQSITRDDLNLDSEEDKKKKEEENKSLKERFMPLIETMKSSLAENIKDVVISDRLSTSAAVLVNSANDPSANMERIMHRMGGDLQAPKVKRILELNLKHPLFEAMIAKPETEQKTWSEILYNQALLNEGSELPDPGKFTKQISDLMARVN